MFWADGPGTETPPGHWNSIAQIIADARGNTWNKTPGCSPIEYRYGGCRHLRLGRRVQFHFWRPVTAIDTYVEPELHWMSFIVTPPFPDYVSGHSTFSGAAATVLPLFYRTEDLPFTTGSDFLPGVYRSFTTCLVLRREKRRTAVSTVAFTSDSRTKMACKPASASASRQVPAICSPRAIAREGKWSTTSLNRSARLRSVAPCAG